MFDESFEKMKNKAHNWAVNRERKFLEDWCAEVGLKEPVAYNYSGLPILDATGMV